VALLALAGAAVVVALSLLGNPAAAPDERQRHPHNG
jgi:hypothetical protein